MMTDPTCARCEHPFDWHDDRAVAGCDGGWDRVDGTRRPWKWGEPIALCPCPGWTQ